MGKMKIKIMKEELHFENGDKMSGIRVMLAPKCSKFIAIRGETEQLLEAINPDVYQWFKNVNPGYTATLVQTLPETEGEL